MIIDKSQYIETVRRPYPPFWSSLILAGSASEECHAPFFRRPYARTSTILCDYLWYYSRESEDLAQAFIAEEWITRKKMQEVESLLEGREKTLLAAPKKGLKALCTAYERYMPALGLVYLAENPIYSRVKHALMEKYGEKEAARLLDKFHTPLRDTMTRMEEFELIKAKNISHHIRKFAWILSRYGSNTPYTLEYARKKLSQLAKNSWLQQYKKHKAELRKAINQAKCLLGRGNSFLVDVLQFILFYRTHRTDVMNRVSYECIPMLTRVGKKAWLSYEDVLFCTKDEVLTAVFPEKKILQLRKRGHAMLAEDTGVRCIIGKEYSYVKGMFYENPGSNTLIKGIGASKGRVQGSARIVLGQADFPKVHQDDILIACMTTPEFAPLLRKVAAFVTDEGGITCHAAIISREMKKPCIIGTKIATKVFKDGDLVEVDANKGIVKILKKGP